MSYIQTEDPDAISDTLTPVMVDIRHLSNEQFANLGLSQIAYVKAVTVNGMAAFAIHGADGMPMAVADNANVALAAIVQQDMLPTRVH